MTSGRHSVEVNHLELEVRGNNRRIPRSARMSSASASTTPDLNVERCLMRAAIAGIARAEKARRARSGFMSLVSVVGPPHAANRRQGEACGRAGSRTEGPKHRGGRLLVSRLRPGRAGQDCASMLDGAQ